MTKEELEARLEQARVMLLTEREKRIYPHVDDKVLTSWNAMMIAGLAKASTVFQNKDYLTIAINAIQFIEEKLFKENRLMARYRDGETKYAAYLDDYAFLAWAYLALYQATYELDYLSRGKSLVDSMINLFWDDENGGFFFSGKENEQLISNDKEIYDGAIPSGNSVAAVVLSQYGSLTGETKYLDLLEEMYFTFYEDISRQASAGTFFMQGLLFTENPTKEVVVIGGTDASRQAVISQLQQEFMPDVVFLVTEQPDQFKPVAPFAAEYFSIEDQTTIYICENFACQQPTTNIDQALTSILKQK